MVSVVDDYISPDLEKVNRAMNHNSLGKIGKKKNVKAEKKGGDNGNKKLRRKPSGYLPNFQKGKGNKI